MTTRTPAPNTVIDNVDKPKIVIRYLRQEDLGVVSTMFAASMLYWPGSPYREGLAQSSKHTAISYGLCQIFIGIMGLAIALSPKAARDALRETGADITHLLWWGGYLMVIATSLASLYFYCYNRTIKSVFRKHAKDATDKDLKDPVAAYSLQCSDGVQGFQPTGPSGFWVAEAAREVIGTISLKVGSDPTTAEVGRFAVSPTHQRRGAGSMLMEAATAHARAHGLRVLILRTSDFNKAAITMYVRKGWVVEKKIAYPGYSNWWRFVIVFRKNLVYNDSEA